MLTSSPHPDPLPEGEGVGCPLIVYTDLDRSFCKATEEGQLARPEPSSRALDPAIGGHPPHGMHDLEGPEHQLDDLARAVWLPPVLGHRSDPTPPRVIERFSLDRKNSSA
jgi:hypothetical protein